MDCHKLSFLVVLMIQDSWIHEAVNCEHLQKDIVVYPFTHQCKGYMPMQCVALFATIFPIRSFE